MMNEARRKAAKEAKLRHPQGIQASYAATIIAYMATFGERQPGDMPFNTAADRVRHARPIDWVLIFEEAQAMVDANAKSPRDYYEECARELEQRMNT